MELTDEQEEILLMGHQIFGRCVDNLNVQWQNLANNIGETIVEMRTLEAEGINPSEHSMLSQLMANRLRQMAGLQLVICTFMYEKVFDTMQVGTCCHLVAAWVVCARVRAWLGQASCTPLTGQPTFPFGGCQDGASPPSLIADVPASQGPKGWH
jgi:hypothetical protein